MSNKTKNKKSFIELLGEYKIKIPVIQREYAQGRDTIKARTVRRKFIESVKKVLLNDESLNMDFIFGVEEGKEFIPIDGQQRLTFLFLLHLYVYALKGETDKEKNVEFLKNFSYEIRSSSKEFVEKLVEHIKDLSEFIKHSSEKLPSDWIKDQEWFLPGWDRDLTIKSMLTVLDDIHKEFKEEFKVKENEIKIEKNLDKIKFKVINIKEIGADEELYIKMNSTGRQLTEFEILKAKFIEFLNTKNMNNKGDFEKKINTKWMNIFWEKFKYKRDNYYEVDSTMLNFFYYMVEMLVYETFDNPKKKSRKGKDKNSQEIPEVIRKFYSYDDNSNKWWKEIPVEDILNECYKQNEVNKQNEDKENKNKLQDWFNLLTFTLDNLEDIHKKIEKILSNGHGDGKVAIWEENPNLLERVIFNNVVKVKNIANKGDKNNKSYNELTLWQKVFLYAFFKAYKKFEKKSKNSTSSENFKDTIHLIRNLIFGVSKGGIEQSLNINSENIHKLLKFLDTEVVNRISMYNYNPYKLIQNIEDNATENTRILKYCFIQEKQKAKYICNNPDAKQYIQKLENHKYLKGDLRIFMEKVEGNPELLKFREGFKKDIYRFTKIFYELFNNKDEDIIPTFLVSILEQKKDGFFRILEYSGKRFFGREGYWGYWLNSLPKYRGDDRRNKLSEVWWSFINKIKDNYSGNVCETLKSIKEDWLRDKDDKCFYRKPEYYFIKYEDFYEDFECLDGIDYNIFAVKFNRNEINWFRAEKIKRERASGHHINPFVYTVAKKVSKEKDKKICDLIAQGWDYNNDNNYDTRLVIKGKDGYIFKAKIDREGWKIEVMDDGKFEELKGKGFNIEEYKGDGGQNGQDSQDSGVKYILNPDHRDLIEVMVDLVKELLKDS